MESELIQAIESIANNIDALAQPRFIDWLAIIVSCISVILSGLAIWFAAHVPRAIANQQNKISLYEKRIYCYNRLNKIKWFLDEINKKDSRDILIWQGAYWQIHDLFNDPNFDRVRYDIIAKVILTRSCLGADQEALYNLQFLLPIVDENEVTKISNQLQCLINDLFKPSCSNQNQNGISDDLIKQMHSFLNCYNAFYERTMKELRPLVKMYK